MEQWFAEYAVDTRSGPKRLTRLFYLPTVEAVRDAVRQEGGHLLTIREHEPSFSEKFMSKSIFWQIQLLRGIQFKSTTTSPSVAFWRLIQAEKNPRTQNILAPAREALSRGLGVIDAIKSLNIFDHATLAILSASERSNKLQEGIPQAIQNIMQRKKNMAKIVGLLGWIGFDLFSIIQSLMSGRGMILGYFRSNVPKDPKVAEEFTRTVDNLEIFWDVLLYFAFAMAAAAVWIIISYRMNRGKTDWPTARFVRRIPLIGSYMRDLGLSDTTMAAARMLRGQVPISDTLRQAALATNVPEISQYWIDSYNDLSRGISLGTALDREPLTDSERTELMTVNDMSQVATVLESISDIRIEKSNSKYKMIVLGAFIFMSFYLLLAFGSAIFALQLMNVSTDSMMEQAMGGLAGGGE